MVPLLVFAVLAAVIGIGIELRWQQRIHYQTLFGRSLVPEAIKRRLFELLEELDQVFSANDIPYWLDWGTLLGAYRHRGFIPWDDDLDVTICHHDHERALALRGQFPPGIELIEISQFWSCDKLIPGLARIWPCKTFLRLLDHRTNLYVDIFEMDKRPSGRLHMLPLSRIHCPKDHQGRQLMIDQAEVFPLEHVHFEERSFPAPRNTQAYLHRLFGGDLSPDRVLDPATGKYVKKRRQAASH